MKLLPEMVGKMGKNGREKLAGKLGGKAARKLNSVLITCIKFSKYNFVPGINRGRAVNKVNRAHVINL